VGLSDPSAIEKWLEARGVTEGHDPHEWTFLHQPGTADPDDQALRALCTKCGLIRRRSLSQNAEMFIDLSGPCPRDSAYWREQQEQRAASRETHGERR
jgi:hypothetical protein